MSGLETIGAIVLAALMALAGFGALGRRKARAEPSRPPTVDSDATERAAIEAGFIGKLDDVNDAATSDTPEQDAADILNRR